LDRDLLMATNPESGPVANHPQKFSDKDTLTFRCPMFRNACLWLYCHGKAVKDKNKLKNKG
jgi:hypothetical protein